MFGDVDYTKVMFGQNAVHVPAWMVMQNQQEGGTLFVGATRSSAPLYGTGMTHVLTLGEVILRPHIAVASDNFVGHGISGFITDNPSAMEWLTDGQVLVHTQQGEDALMKWK